ncbi:MAG: GNAT family N-acetyltransferase [Planctomycetes bacterium]|nr:GNAT family N-acetyltransferase [Planctomycetota bacterium]
MPGQPTLTTRELTLRPYAPADVPSLVRLCSPREIAATTALIPHPYTEVHARSFIEQMQGGWDRGDGFVYAMTRTVDGELVGSMGLKIDQAQQRAEVGYTVSVPCWGRGYATQALEAVLSVAFGTLALRRVYAYYFVENAASGRVLEKCGFQREGLLRGHVLKWGEPRDMIVMGMLKGDWEAGPIV